MRLIKYFVVPILALSVLVQTLGALVVLTEFEINQKYYAEILCINKSKPELACKGKCVLMRRIQSKIEQKQTSERQKIQDFLDRTMVLFFENKSIKIHAFSRFVFTSKEKPNFNHADLMAQLNNYSIFHPPII